MNCEKVREIMQSALDREAGEAALAAIREHLGRCPQCRQAWDEARAIAAGLGEMARAGEVPPPATLHRRIMAAVQEEQRRQAAGRRPRRRVAAWPRWAAAAVLLAGLGVCWLAVPRHGEPPSPRETLATGGGAWLPADTLDENALSLASLFETPKQDIKDMAGSILASATPLLGVVETVQQQENVKDKLAASRAKGE